MKFGERFVLAILLLVLSTNIVYAYENHCWDCGSRISSDFCERCNVCGWYICTYCGACAYGGCSGRDTTKSELYEMIKERAYGSHTNDMSEDGASLEEIRAMIEERVNRSRIDDTSEDSSYSANLTDDTDNDNSTSNSNSNSSFIGTLMTLICVWIPTLLIVLTCAYLGLKNKNNR